MTPQPPEMKTFVIWDFELEELTYGDRLDTKKRLNKDVRSRPAPASAPIAPTEDNELEELGNQDIDPAVFEAYANACNKGAEEQYFKEYAATIRNETLEIFMTAIENRFDDTNQGRGVVGTIRSIKESVRQGEQE